MDLIGRPIPALANDDSHALESDHRDTYQAWNMVKVKERSAEAIINALENGCGYVTNGPEIQDIQLRRVNDLNNKDTCIEATILCSEAQNIFAIDNLHGMEYRSKDGKTFEKAILTLRPNLRWVRFEIIGPDGKKAWSNPIDLVALEK